MSQTKCPQQKKVFLPLLYPVKQPAQPVFASSFLLTMVRFCLTQDAGIRNSRTTCLPLTVSVARLCLLGGLVKRTQPWNSRISCIRCPKKYASTDVLNWSMKSRSDKRIDKQVKTINHERLQKKVFQSSSPATADNSIKNSGKKWINGRRTANYTTPVRSTKKCPRGMGTIRRGGARREGKIS